MRKRWDSIISPTGTTAFLIAITVIPVWVLGMFGAEHWGEAGGAIGSFAGIALVTAAWIWAFRRHLNRGR